MENNLNLNSEAPLPNFASISGGSSRLLGGVWHPLTLTIHSGVPVTSVQPGQEFDQGQGPAWEN